MKELKFFDLSNVAFFKFNNKNHLINHLNYLFRTDSDQKWTNQNTKDNYLIVFDLNGNEEKYDTYLPDDDSKRNNIKKELLEELENIDLKKLRFSRIECPYDDVYWDTDGVYEEALVIMKALQSSMIDDQSFHLILFITHVDQYKNYTHFHILGYVE